MVVFLAAPDLWYARVSCPLPPVSLSRQCLDRTPCKAGIRGPDPRKTPPFCAAGSQAPEFVPDTNPSPRQETVPADPALSLAPGAGAQAGPPRSGDPGVSQAEGDIPQRGRAGGEAYQVPHFRAKVFLGQAAHVTEEGRDSISPCRRPLIRQEVHILGVLLPPFTLMSSPH